MFSGEVLRSVSIVEEHSTLLPQYSLLGERLELTGSNASLIDYVRDPSLPQPSQPDTRIFFNVNTPSSTFLCGSQGSGKSHTLSCMLEAALQPSKLGDLPQPLSAIVFHYDRFRSYASKQICEAAHLCSSGIPVRILVSPANFWAMKTAYENIPGLREGATKLEVISLLLADEQLDAEKLMTLMAFKEGRSGIPLYMEVCAI